MPTRDRQALCSFGIPHTFQMTVFFLYNLSDFILTARVKKTSGQCRVKAFQFFSVVSVSRTFSACQKTF